MMVTKTTTSILCAGLSCLDLQLLGCTQSSNNNSNEAIERYDEAVHCAGGSSSMTATTLALLLRPSSSRHRDGNYSESGDQVHIITKIGRDFAGDTLLEFYRRAGISTSFVHIDDEARTSMAVLPVFKPSGKRGCFVNLACNDGFEPEQLISRVDAYVSSTEESYKNTEISISQTDVASTTSFARAFLFGYPHLLPKMQGQSLKEMLFSVRQKLDHAGPNEEAGVNNRVLVGVDLNGVDGSDPSSAKSALNAALPQIDVLHLNEDEAMVLSSSEPTSPKEDTIQDDIAIIPSKVRSQIQSFHDQGCAVVLLSLGSKGAFISVTPNADRLHQLSSPPSSLIHSSPVISQWKAGTQVHIPAYRIDEGDVNTNGAGDALFAGFCLAASSWGQTSSSNLVQGNDNKQWEVTPKVAGTFASLVAWQRCNVKTRDGGNAMKDALGLMQMIVHNNLPPILD